MSRLRVLILDDGELGHVDASLRRLGLEPLRASGDEIHDGLPMPSDLLITTPSRALPAPQRAATGKMLKTPSDSPQRSLSVRGSATASKNVESIVVIARMQSGASTPSIWIR